MEKETGYIVDFDSVFGWRVRHREEDFFQEKSV
jgi:hypothetical protein